MKTLLLTVHFLSAPVLSPPAVYAPPVERSILNSSVDPMWLFIGMAIGAVLSGFTIGGVVLAVNPEGIPMTMWTKVSKLEAAREALAAIERVYLRAAGFRYGGNDYWYPPKAQGPSGSGKFRHHVYRTGHAVNALKYWDATEVTRWP